MVLQTEVQGTVHAGFEAVRGAFAENFARHGEVGAACCVHLHGRRVVDLWGGTMTPDGGDAYTGSTLQMVMSSTKGVVAVAAHMLAEEGGLDFNAPVTHYWPEFAAEGKQDIPVRWLFCHRAGLVALEKPVTPEETYQWTPVVEALAAQRPQWEPGSRHGYHVVTYGWLAGEVIRRVAGKSVGRLVAERIAKPLNLEFWIGLPDYLNPRVAPLIPAPPPPPGTEPDPFAARLANPTSLLYKAFVNPYLTPRINDPALRAAEIPGANGIGTARALSRMYAACIGAIDGVRLLKPETLMRATATQSSGQDAVLGYETRYGTGFQLSFPFRPMAGEGSFGHYGMGGSVGFAHAGLGLSFAYVMNQMRSAGGVDPRSDGLVQAVLRSLR